MHKTSRILAAGATMVFITNIAAQAATLPHGYEGDYLPQDPSSSPQWQKVLDSGNTSESVDNGILTVYSGAVDQYIEYRLMGGEGGAWNAGGNGTTIETRFKTDYVIGDGNLYSGFLVLSMASQHWVLYIGPNYITNYTGGYLPVVTDDDFHTYRFVLSDETTGSLDLYIDNDFSAPAFTYAGTAGGANYIGFGDGSASELAGQIQWDYIRWSNDGAFVPEPTQLAMLLPALIGLRRRRPR